MLSCPHIYLLQTYINIDTILQYKRHIKRHFMLLENLLSPESLIIILTGLTLTIKKHKSAIVNEYRTNISAHKNCCCDIKR